MEGTSGAVELDFFREEAGQTALTGESRRWRGEPGWLVRETETVTARSQGLTSSGSGRAAAGDRRCPSRIGWGKSIAVSGRRDGGR